QPRRRIRTGPAKPRRSVCAPTALASSLYRRPVLERRSIMWFSSWLRNRSARRCRPAPRSRPSLEVLERRDVPSTLMVTHDLNIHAAANAIHGTLPWAVANAQNGDTIVLTGDAARNGITLAGSELILTQENLTIETEAGFSPAAISGGNLSRVFELANGASVTLDNVLITGGNGVSNNPAPTRYPDCIGGGLPLQTRAPLAPVGRRAARHT